MTVNLADTISRRLEEFRSADGMRIIIDWNRAYTHDAPGDAHTLHRGISLRLDPNPGSGGGTFGYLRDGAYIRHYWTDPTTRVDRPTWALGVPEDQVQTTIERLIDTGRAHAAYQHARASRTGRYLAALTAHASRVREAIALPDSNQQRTLTIEDAKRRRDITIGWTLAENLLSNEEIADAAQVPADRVAALDHAANYERRRPELYLDYAGVAIRWGIKPASVRSYNNRGYLPVPDLQLGDAPGWAIATIEACTRPGSGSRTDLK